MYLHYTVSSRSQPGLNIKQVTASEEENSTNKDKSTIIISAAIFGVLVVVTVGLILIFLFNAKKR